uniref:Phosphomannomutase n=1 Tax=Riptortus pedestris TaxID=329032 RepID=R4WDL4_RIPPE|nr:phosphomannomutase [Riptortus pedestris]
MELIRKNMIALFDVDGTLTLPRKSIDPDFRSYVLNLKKVMHIGLVGGSDMCKIAEQMGGPQYLKEFDYVFSENGLVAMKDGEVFAKKNIAEQLGEDVLQTFINGCLEYMSTIALPVKRGTFIEYRTGLINVCPVGRNCSQEERDAFEQYDLTNHVREKFINHLKAKFPALPLEYLIGGQISFDVFPKGWNKTYCLQFLTQFDKIYFCGDKCNPGGNDYELFSHPKVIGTKTKGPNDTKEYIQKLYDQHAVGDTAV